MELDLSVVQQWLAKNGVSVAIQFVTAIVIYVVGKWVAAVVTKLIAKAMEKRNVDKTLIAFLTNVGYAILMTFVIIAALNQLGLETTSLVAILGAAGLAIGLALQGSLANFASGVLIILFRPFRIGDFIEGAGTMGVVEDIQIFSTQLRTGDNKTIIVPNSALTGGLITNYSMKETRRVDLIVGVAYDADIRKTKAVLEDVLKKESRLLADPAPVVELHEMAASSLNFVVRPWVNTADYWVVYWALNAAIKEALDEAEIGIPFPQMDVHLHKQENS